MPLYICIKHAWEFSAMYIYPIFYFYSQWSLCRKLVNFMIVPKAPLVSTPMLMLSYNIHIHDTYAAYEPSKLLIKNR